LLYKGIEDQLNWHGKALGKESANALKAIKENNFKKHLSSILMRFLCKTSHKDSCA
jgi:hypothetical protein